MSLEEAFPSLFSIAITKEAWVQYLWGMEHSGGCRNRTFSLPFNDWELEDVESFLSRIGEKRIIEGMKDTI